MLQIKDRHNGNILLDDKGHVIHIDFGFMLSNSPGNVSFETAPFKLTRELLEIMDVDLDNGRRTHGDAFNYYKLLCIRGFLALRKHCDRIVSMVEIMSKSGCPCFKVGARCKVATTQRFILTTVHSDKVACSQGGPRAVRDLEKRFQRSMTDTDCVQWVLSLIEQSVDAWRSRQYDYYQRVLNGIL
eukprot:scaffold2313_cov202-Prasinococcus_capsulatus_cf.AAC.3